MHNHEIKTSFVSPEMPEAQANKTGFSMIVHFYIFKKLDIKRFSVMLKSRSNPADINRFRSHTGKGFI